MKSIIALLMFVSTVSSADELDKINGYWTVDRWGEHRLCIFVGNTVEDAKNFKCFPVPDRVFRQVAA